MQKEKENPAAIENYIREAPPALQPRLRELHRCIAGAAPGSTEAIKWSMPTFSYRKILVAFAVFKNHTGFYPMPSALRAFEEKLGDYRTGKGSVQFPHDRPLPLPLIRAMVEFRVKETAGDGAAPGKAAQRASRRRE